MMQNVVDLSPALSQLFQQLFSWIASIFNVLDNIMIFHGVSLLKLIIAVVVIGMIISAIFVFFDGGDYDE